MSVSSNQLWTGLVAIAMAFCIWIPYVNGDVSEINNIRVSSRGQKQLALPYNGDNSNNFSILTKEFLNRPDNETNGYGPSNGRSNKPKTPKANNRNSPPFLMLKINGLDVNNLAENDDSGEQEHRGYVYDKPKIPFEAEDRESTNIQSTTVAPQREEEPYDGSQGYSYPRPRIPFDLPKNSPDSDVETIPGAASRSING